MSQVVDAVQSLVTWATANLSYVDDDGNTQNAANNGLEVYQWLEAEKHPAGVPRIIIGPIGATVASPWNIGASPEARWEYAHSVEVHLDTIRCANPNISGYNAKIRLTEAIEDALVQHIGDIDGTGNWYIVTQTAGPKDVLADSDPANDMFHVVFIIEMKRQKVR